MQFLVDSTTTIPLIVLLAGLIVAALSFVALRAILIARDKSAHLQAFSRALADSEERYELAMQGMTVGIWDWHVPSNALYWSDKFKQIIGVKSSEYVPHFDEFVSRLHPEDRAATLSMLEGHVAGRNAYDVEYRLRHDDGHYVWIHAYGQAKFDANGAPVRMAGSVQDITRKKLQDQAIKQSEQQLRLLIEHTPAAVAMLDRNLRYIMTSRRWLEDYGLTGQEIIGKGHYEIFPEIGAMPHWLDIHQRALRGEIYPRSEDSWLRSNGQREWNEWAIHPWTDANGEVGGIIMFTEVITARKQSEAALRTSEEANRAAMEFAPIGKALVLPNGRFTKVNPALCKLLGYSEDDLLANDFQSITHPDDLERDLELLQRLLCGDIPSYEIEKRYFHRDGREIWALLSVAPVRRANGEPEFLVAQVQDISERKAIEHMKSEFISVVSHELRTPLTSIRASLGLIAGMRDETLSPRVSRLVEISHESCERLVLLVNDILDLDKINSGQMRFDMKVESLATITSSALKSMEAYATKFEVEFVAKPIPDDIFVRVDADRYIQVLSNLLSNAAKFSPRSGKVILNVEMSGEKVRVQVRDSGPGIPEEFHARVFGRFAQAESSATRQKGGTGLGLHITKNLVEKMGGEIGFRTELSVGTVFWVEFPVVAPVPDEHALDLGQRSVVSRS